MYTSPDFFKKSSFAIAIAFIFPILVHTGISSLYPYPTTTESETTQSSNQVQNTEAVTISNSAIAAYYSTFFYVQLIASCGAIFLGIITPLEFLSTGWVMAGILTILSGVIFYWRYLSSTVLFMSLLIVLFILIIGGYYAEKK